jgi:hypothetical protein
MKKYVKALSKEGECFKYTCQKITAVTEAKFKEGIFSGPDIRKLMADATFESTMFATEKAAWKAFRGVVTKFLGNMRDANYADVVSTMLDAFKDLGCDMSLKFHFLHSYLDYFPETLRYLNEEQGERFYKDVKEVESR